MPDALQKQEQRGIQRVRGAGRSISCIASGRRAQQTAGDRSRWSNAITRQQPEQAGPGARGCLVANRFAVAVAMQLAMQRAAGYSRSHTCCSPAAAATAAAAAAAAAPGPVGGCCWIPPNEGSAPAGCKPDICIAPINAGADAAADAADAADAAGGLGGCTDPSW